MKTKPDEPPHPPQNKAISANTERGTAPDNTAPKGPKKGVGANRYAKLGPFRYRPVENKTGRPKGTGAIRKTGTAKSAARSSKAGETSGMSERISKTSTARATGRREGKRLRLFAHLPTTFRGFDSW